MSIVIPVYNVENYVGECLSSIVTQEFDRSLYEIVVINDGTQDNSMSIVKQYAQDYPGIIVFEQDNKGLSAARSLGMQKAHGVFVWFVDSDDFLVPGAITRVLNLIASCRDCNLFVFPTLWRYQDSGKTEIDMHSESCSGEGREFLRDGKSPSWIVPRFIIRRSLFTNKSLFFPVGKLHEDVYFGPVLLYLSGDTRIEQGPVYVYRKRPNSIMTARSVRSSYDMLSMYYLLKAFKKESVSSEDSLWFDQLLVRVLLDTYKVSKELIGTESFSRFYKENASVIIGEYKSLHNKRSFIRKQGDLFMFRFPSLYFLLPDKIQ